MKKIFITLSAAVLFATSTFAQCSDVKNNFEIKLVPTTNQQLKIQIRHHQEVVANEAQLPISSAKLDGLVYAISWPSTSTVQLTEAKNSLTPFNIIGDVAAGYNKTSADHFQTFFHDNIATMPVEFGKNWVNDQWYDLATISYTGKLATGDYFSLMNCDYGISHPNSYNGNSNTDPWLAIYGTDNKYAQYSPKMITELPSTTTDFAYKVFPVPTINELNIEILSAINTQAAAKIVDGQGKIVKIINFEVSKGKNTNVISIADIAVGNYFIIITDGKSLNYSQKVSKN
jgi:Secretion system C-terminal sorting domain